MHNGLTDEDLAERVRDGHSEMWAELARRVIGLARRRIWNHVPECDREDVEQDVLIGFWRSLPSFSRDRGAVRGLVAVMTQRKVADFWRARGGGPAIEPVDEWVLDIAEAVPAGGNTGPDLEAWIDEAVGSESGRMLRMHVFHGHTYAQIGAECGISEAAAKQRVRSSVPPTVREMPLVRGCGAPVA